MIYTMEIKCNGCEAIAKQDNLGINIPSFDSLVPTRLTPSGLPAVVYPSLSQGSVL
jgi:hypothetical protein